MTRCDSLQFDPHERTLRRFFWPAGQLFTLLFFSASQSKLPGYILPAIPPAVLLIGASVARHSQRKSGILSWMVVGIGLLFPSGTGIALAEWAHARPTSIIHCTPKLREGLKSLSLRQSFVGGLIAGFSIRGKHNECDICRCPCCRPCSSSFANRLILPGDRHRLSRQALQGPTSAAGCRRMKSRVYRLPRAASTA